jgi:hypothetical protein
MTVKQLIKKPMTFWYRTYYGRVTPMMRVFKNKQEKPEEATDYNLLGLEPIIKDYVKSGQFKIIDNNSRDSRRYDVIDLTKPEEKPKSLYIFWFYLNGQEMEKDVEWRWHEGNEEQAWEDFVKEMIEDEVWTEDDKPEYHEIYEVADAKLIN